MTNSSSRGSDGAPSESIPVVRDLHKTSDIRFVIAQVASLEERVNNLVAASAAHREDHKEHRAEFRFIRNGLVFGFLTLAGLALHLYSRVDDKIEHRDDRVIVALDKVEAKVGATETQLQGLQVSVGRIETKLDDVSARIPAPKH